MTKQPAYDLAQVQARVSGMTSPMSFEKVMTLSNGWTTDVPLPAQAELIRISKLSSDGFVVDANSALAFLTPSGSAAMEIEHLLDAANVDRTSEVCSVADGNYVLTRCGFKAVLHALDNEPLETFYNRVCALREITTAHNAMLNANMTPSIKPEIVLLAASPIHQDSGMAGARIDDPILLDSDDEPILLDSDDVLLAASPIHQDSGMAGARIDNPILLDSDDDDDVVMDDGHSDDTAVVIDCEAVTIDEASSLASPAVAKSASNDVPASGFGALGVVTWSALELETFHAINVDVCGVEDALNEAADDVGANDAASRNAALARVHDLQHTLAPLYAQRDDALVALYRGEPSLRARIDVWNQLQLPDIPDLTHGAFRRLRAIAIGLAKRASPHSPSAMAALLRDQQSELMRLLVVCRRLRSPLLWTKGPSVFC
ncbi:hypothetical protein SDRG_03368 [Saprolegnia diclina VS20]|uniref:Uncharacterized protein n=1 Tax=Saprolegnia diclina (strain VS20) TaxID=1156394 RepID=T0S915_SAPDV|nr:hypothetical protein SDRG_03368 [Saprolegnia diclina VS20]EQC39162.1 hypothetical protein SDRG_03368 [Saprolegnia diclina VS20]|eukprot:XP_008607223.1 hypothetical protein SDRG_03368 [Saprolegnia diclina VS20]